MVCTEERPHALREVGGATDEEICSVGVGDCGKCVGSYP